MIIKKLELQGFKSFSDRTKLVFHDGITAVIGPNGTGKSNIVDALLWVLGGKRLKGLRGERSGDVIFNGNAKVAPLGMADVTLILGDNEEELNISHRVFRSKESEYRMDGKQVRLRDIQETLYQKAIGDSQYFVIEQGNIGIFLSSKPLEKRALLEEAAGTAFYKDRKRQAELKLENTEQNLTRLEDIIDEVAKAKNALKRQANSAIRYRELREKIRELTLLHYRERITRAEKAQHDAFLNFQKCTDLERDVLYKVKDIEKILAEKRKELWNLESSNKKDQETLFTMKNRLSQSETERERETKRIDLVDEKKKRDRETAEELKQELLTLDADKNEAEKNINTLSEALSRKHDEMETFDKTGQTFQQEIEVRQKTIEKIRGDALVNLSELTEMRNERAKFEKELEILHRQDGKLRADMESERKRLSEAEERLKNIEEELEREKRDLQEKNNILAKDKDSCERLNASIQKLQSRQLDLDKQKEKGEHHLHALEQLLEKEKTASASFDIPESPGLLVDLIESDPEYTPAVDIFWREEAKARLVHAKNLLEELGKGNIKGNFLLLSEHKTQELSPEIFKNPRVLGRLKAKVKADPKIKANLSPLRDAAIVESVKDAVDLWMRYPSENFITSRGDVLYSSGLLSLGEKKEGILAMNRDILSLKDKIQRLVENMSPLLQEIEEKLDEKQKFEQRIEGAEKSLIQLERQIDAKEKEISFSRTDHEKTETSVILFKKEIDLLSQDTKTTGERFSSLTAKVKDFEDKDQAFKKRIEAEAAEIARLQEKGKQERNNFFELKSQTNILQEKINNLRERTQAIDQRKEAIHSKTRSLEQDMQDAERQNIDLQKRMKDISDGALKLGDEIKEKEKGLAASEVRLMEIQTEQAALENRLEARKGDFESKKDMRVQSEIKKAEVERDLVNLEESCWQELRKTIQEVKEEVTGDIIPYEHIEEELEASKDRLQKIGNVNLMAEEEFTIQEKRVDFLVQEREDLRESIASTKEAISRIDKESKSQFMTALEAVNKNFKEVFTILFEGGNAEVKLIDPNSPLESGVEIEAQPPGKRLQSLSLLSGGEKSLTSLAFFFALFRYKPTPFCILDEVDAALDDANLGRFLNLMKKIKTQTQFIIITHNSKTMEVADYIYGTTMAEPNITNVFSVKMEKDKAREK